ncbi:MAG: hemolysin family protein [Alphaproteobacteria bacterium]|nr:hemolysin family protein [Alphaproteobacteria bacterium]
MDILATVLIIAACLAAEAFFSGSEIAIVSADKLKLRHAAANGSRGASLALSMLERPEWLLSTTLVGTNICIVTNTTVATGAAIYWLGQGYGWVAVAVVTPLIWIFGEIVPKSVFQQRADTITPIAVFALRIAHFLFWPILWVFAFLTRALSWVAGDGDAKNPFTMREEIRTLVEMSSPGGDILPEERSMIRRVFRFSEVTAGEIMVPLIDVVGIDRKASSQEAIQVAVDSAHKRLPVFDQRVDKIVGTLDVLDLLSEDPEAPVAPFVRPVRCFAASKSIEELFMEFAHSDMIAVVVDEFGGAEGIVTLEDILEEVVGELEDEFDEAVVAESMIRHAGKNRYLVSARAPVDDVNEAVGTSLPEGDYETLGGFLISLTGEIPVQGQVIEYEGFTFTILRATEQAVQEVRIVVPSV